MTIKLELMEIVWLQKIQKNPGKYTIKDQDQWLVNLVECGLVHMRMIETGFHLTLNGRRVLKGHLPYTSSDLNRQFNYHH